MKAVLFTVFMLPLTICNAQSVPCFEPIEKEPIKTVIDIRTYSIFALKTM